MSAADDRRWTRRTLLRRGLATASLVAGGAGLASGQETTEDSNNTLTPGVIAEQETYDQSMVGFFVHISQPIDPAGASVDDDCEFVTWGNEQTQAYDAELIDRTADPQQATITLYLRQEVLVQPGTLFIVNNVVRCESGYVGLRLERIGARPEFRDGSGAGTTAVGGGADGPTTAADGPGFGVLSGLAGALGAGWLLGRDREP